MDKVLDCSSFENRIQDLMDERIELRTDQGIQDHAARCESCRSILNSFESLELALGAAFSVGMSDQPENSEPFVSPKVTDRQNLLSGWSIAGALIAMAAMLLVMIQPNQNSMTSFKIADSQPSLARKLDQPPEVIKAPAADSIIELPSDINVAVYETIPVSLRNAYHYAAELPGIRPIECSINVTLDVLQRSLGPAPAPEPADEDPDLGQAQSTDRMSLA